MTNTDETGNAAPSQPHDREPSFWAMIAETFRGRNRWMTIMVWIYLWAFVAVGALAAVMFFRVDALADKILYAALFVSMVVFVGLLKTWIWALMNRNAVLRELRRLEQRLAALEASCRR
ncbi:MAG: hypothetical protein KGY99_07660 [Phycisphaerae bacterium]|nr:hypothetical protein [Phycisphaerae bacterium]